MTSLNSINVFTISDTVGASLDSQWFIIKFSFGRLFYQGSYFLEIFFLCTPQDILSHPWSWQCDFSSFFSWCEQPLLCSCWIPALIFCFHVDFKSWPSKCLKPNWGSDIIPPNPSSISLYCLLCSDTRRIAPSSYFFFFCNISYVFTLFFKFLSRIFRCLRQERSHVSCTYHVLATRKILLWLSFYLE